MDHFYTLITSGKTTQGVKKSRKNKTCDMDAWYYQTENNTLAYAILKGTHGERKDIPTLRRYFICQGEAVYIIDGKEYKVGAGSVIEIPSLATYDFHSVGDNPVSFFVDVGFKLDLDTIPSK